MFRALLADLQQAVHKQQLVYFVHITLAGCYQGWSGTAVVFVYALPPEDKQAVLETCTGC
jgi:hypothetical protein